jgi:26S proteasome regulatory subunit N9
MKLTLNYSYSLGLIKGSIDQVNSLANIHWVQPRVLDADQSRALYERLSEWSDRVGAVGETVSVWRQPLGVVA